MGNVVMKASRSEAAREVEWADESNLPHARLQGQAPGGRWKSLFSERRRCGESDVVGTPPQRPRKLSKRGRARCGTHRTGFILAVLRRRGGVRGGGGMYERRQAA